MTRFQQCLRDEMVRRNYSPTTIRSYLHALGTDATAKVTGVMMPRASWECPRCGAAMIVGPILTALHLVTLTLGSRADGPAIGHHPRPKIPLRTP